jgi:hypothetical protein
MHKGKRKLMTCNGSENEDLFLQGGHLPTAGPRRSSFSKFNTATYHVKGHRLNKRWAGETECSSMDRDGINPRVFRFTANYASTRINLNLNILLSDGMQKRGKVWPKVKPKLYKEIRQQCQQLCAAVKHRRPIKLAQAVSWTCIIQEFTSSNLGRCTGCAEVFAVFSDPPGRFYDCTS